MITISNIYGFELMVVDADTLEGADLTCANLFRADLTEAIK